MRTILLMLLFVLFSGVWGGCLDSGGSGGSGSLTVILDPHFDDGAYEISGTVELPGDSVSGSYIQLQVNRKTWEFYSELVGTCRTTAAKEFGYRIVGVSDGDYTVRIRVDRTGNMVFGDSGDYEGYYSGTTGAPVQDELNADLITIAGASSEINDFGVAPLP